MVRHLTVLALALGAGNGCLPPNRPADLVDWDACVVRDAALDPSRFDASQLAITRGTNQVLTLHVRWGGGGLIAVEHNWGELLVELPANLHAGQQLVLQATSPSAEYREGHSITNYQSDRIVGRVHVLSVDDDELTLQLELRAREPSVDLVQRGEQPLEGRVRAKRVSSPGECP